MKDYTGIKKVDKQHYIESPGMYFEDFEVGVTIEHWPGRTITETDNIWQSMIVGNQHPLHINRDYGENTEFGQNLIGSLITFSVVNGMTVSTISAKCIANLGWEDVKLTAPVFVGDTLYARTTIKEARLSKSRREQGVVKVYTEGYKLDGTVVISFFRNILVPTRNYNSKKIQDENS